VFHHVGFLLRSSRSSATAIRLSKASSGPLLPPNGEHCFALPDLKTRKCTMSMTTDKEYEHLGDTRGIEDHDHDLIHELSRRLDCVWRYDQYIANCGGRPELQEFWRGVKSQDQKNIDQLKKLIKQHVQSNCF
jgi:hypothetical protein